MTYHVLIVGVFVVGKILVHDRLKVASGRAFGCRWGYGLGRHTHKTYARMWRRTVKLASYTVQVGGEILRHQAAYFREAPSSEVGNRIHIL
jgi:hypothetical protein